MSEKIEMPRKAVEDLFNYFGSKIPHPHGEDVRKFLTNEDEDGVVTKEHKHTKHIHRSGMAYTTLEHKFYHYLGKKLGKLKYEVVEE